MKAIFKAGTVLAKLYKSVMFLLIGAGIVGQGLVCASYFHDRTVYSEDVRCMKAQLKIDDKATQSEALLNLSDVAVAKDKCDTNADIAEADYQYIELDYPTGSSSSVAANRNIVVVPIDKVIDSIWPTRTWITNRKPVGFGYWTSEAAVLLFALWRWLRWLIA